MESYILLENVKFYAYHGVLEQETLVGNYFEVNLKLNVDFKKALCSDCLDNTVSYALVYDIVKQEMNINSKLLEHVAGRIINALKSRFPEIKKIELKISKLNPPMNGEVEKSGVLIIC